jgi:hypothetical protein
MDFHSYNTCTTMQRTGSAAPNKQTIHFYKPSSLLVQHEAGFTQGKCQATNLSNEAQKEHNPLEAPQALCQIGKPHTPASQHKMLHQGALAPHKKRPQ